MSEPYATKYQPAAPSVAVYFGVPGERTSFGPFEAIIDSGADISIMPSSLIAEMGLASVFEGRVRGQWSASKAVHMYLVDVELANHRLPSVMLARDDDGDEIILGRNVLNKLVILLDGPQRQTHVLESGQAQRLRQRLG